MRLLLVGAFPYPHHQGSQVYFQEQAIALRTAGAEITLLTYGAGRRREVGSSRTLEQLDRNTSSQSWDENQGSEFDRALDGFEHLRSPKWTAPSSLDAGPSLAKPLADLGLAMTLRDALASKRNPAHFDAILTHNAEAALVALHALGKPRPPIVYCAHTLMGHEISAYLRGPKSTDYRSKIVESSKIGNFSIPILDLFGTSTDQWIAKRIDGWIALTHESHRVMRHHSNAPGILVPPFVPDPMTQISKLDSEALLSRHNLRPNAFFLYSGNFDAYQELDIFVAAASLRATRLVRENADGASTTDDSLPLVIASHSVQAAKTPAWAASIPGIEFHHVRSAAEMQGLLAGARASLLMRRTEGGFPIKLVNSLAVGTPVLAFQEGEWGLAHQRNSLICDPERPAESLAAAIERLTRDEGLASGLSQGARDLYLKRHQPEESARKTLELLEEICTRHRDPKP